MLQSLELLRWLHYFACFVIMPCKLCLTSQKYLTASRCPTTMLVLPSVGLLLYDTVPGHLPTVAMIAACIFFATSPFVFPTRGNCDLFLGECDFAFSVIITPDRLLSLVCIILSVILVHIRSYIRTVTTTRVYFTVVMVLTGCMFSLVGEVNSREQGALSVDSLEIVLPFIQP